MTKDLDREKNVADGKATITLPGIVEKIIQPLDPNQPEKAQIAVEGADHLYREIRFENRLQCSDGQAVGLKPGAEVDVTIVAEPQHTRPAKRPRRASTAD